MNFADFLIENEQTVSGPGINALIETMFEMAQRGAPNEYNDYGFNKQDWNFFITVRGELASSGGAIPPQLAISCLKVLSHYKNTQLPSYSAISELVRKDFESAKLHKASKDDDKIIVYNKQPTQYGKIMVYIPGGLDRSATIMLNKLIDKHLEQKGVEKEYDKWGKYGYGNHRFKLLNKDKKRLDVYWIHPEIIKGVLAVLEKKGYSVVWEDPVTKDTPQAAAQQQTKDVEVVGLQDTQYGKKIIVKFNKYNDAFQVAKSAGLSPKGIAYSGNKQFQITATDKSLYDQVHQILADRMDVSDLDAFVADKGLFDGSQAAQAVSQPDGAQSKAEFEFTDQPGTAMLVKVPYRSPEDYQFAKQSVIYLFPENQWTPDDPKNKKIGRYKIQGTYAQYVNFGFVLKKFNYDVSKLREILKAKLARKDLETGDWEGNVPKGFIEKIDEQFPDSEFDLYDAQKEGIAFLFSRRHAILGDETGLGKTVQLIYAAQLRSQASGGLPILIVTVNKIVQQQFAETIRSVIGQDADISMDTTQPAHWTVSYYHNFSPQPPSKVKQHERHKLTMDACKKMNFGIVIYDELHKVKKADTGWTKALREVAANARYKWGASATVSSNKPIDVQNQLVMVGHPLGDIKLGRFKRDFAGMQATGYGGAYQAGSLDKQIEAAENLNKWLNISGLYVRRSKSDVRDMPNIHVGSSTTTVDDATFQKLWAAKISQYKKTAQDMAVSQLIAARDVVASLKAAETASRVANIVVKNQDKPENNYAASKVVVFTSFIDAGKLLVSKIQDKLSQINPEYKVITYLSFTKKAEREKVKERFTVDPNAKVLVMSIRMGGTGIDFPNAAQNMVVNDFDWTPEAAEQSEGRIYRINTNQDVNITYVVAHGIDATIYEKVQTKRRLATIIQKYRRELQANPTDTSALQKIVQAQKQMQQADEEMKAAVTQTTGAKMESFRDYLAHYESLWG